MTTVAATYFDGRHAKAHSVAVGIMAGRVSVAGDGILREVPIDVVEITDAIGRTPRLVRFADGALCEITDVEAFARLLAEQGFQQSIVSRWERHRGWIVASATGFILARCGWPIATGCRRWPEPSRTACRLQCCIISARARSTSSTTRC